MVGEEPGVHARTPGGELASFTCPKCGRTSHNPMDVFEQYCDTCHEWFNAYGPMHYDRAGKPISTMQWSELHSDHSYVRVAETYRENIRVSTVWMGVGYSFGVGPPSTFETAVFGPDGTLSYVKDRYRTLAAAIRGHKGEVLWVTRNTPFSNPRPLSPAGRVVSRKYHARKRVT